MREVGFGAPDVCNGVEFHWVENINWMRVASDFDTPDVSNGVGFHWVRTSSG